MNKVKKYILEEHEDAQFIPGKDKFLIGYAEMFGKDCIPLYKGINCFLYKTPKKVIEKIRVLNPKARKADGFENTLIGCLKMEDGKSIFLHDKNAIIGQLKKEYMQDKSGLFDGDEDCEINAIEMYDYNIIGSYMDGIPAFAILYSK